MEDCGPVLNVKIVYVYFLIFPLWPEEIEF